MFCGHRHPEIYNCQCVKTRHHDGKHQAYYGKSLLTWV